MLSWHVCEYAIIGFMAYKHTCVVVYIHYDNVAIGLLTFESFFSKYLAFDIGIWFSSTGGGSLDLFRLLCSRVGEHR